MLLSRLLRPQRIDVKKARVALARKLAVLLHHLWSRQEDFCWAKPMTI